MLNNRITAYNKRQWEALVDAGVPCSRPVLNMTLEQARSLADKHGILGELHRRTVLCLAQGGGQQSVAFALLGAQVTVFDQSEKQLARDREAAEHYGFEIRTVRGDIRDLSAFDEGEFTVVSQGYSINFVPQVDRVFDDVARVLRAGGKYELMCHNPFVHGSWVDGCWGSRWPKEDLWKGEGYPIRLAYIEGAEITTLDPHWNFFDGDGNPRRVPSPQEFRHLLSTVINGLVDRRLAILKIVEWPEGDPNSEPGSWDHYVSFAPPWLTIWSQKEEVPLNRGIDSDQ